MHAPNARRLTSDWRSGSLQVVGILLVGGALLVVGAYAVLMAAYAPRAFLTVILVSTAILGWRPVVALDAVTPLGAYIGSYRIAPYDLLAVVAIGASLVIVFRDPKLLTASSSMMLLTVAVAIGIVASISVLGLQEAVVYWRNWIYSIVFFWWARFAFGRFSNFPISPFVVGALAAVALWALEVVKNGLGSADMNVVNEDGIILSSRPVSSSVALLGLVAIVMFVTSPRSRTPIGLACLASLGLFVLLSQHRSVWVSGIAAGLAAVAVYGSRAGNRVAGIARGALGILVILVAAREIVSSVSELTYSATSSGTWDGRIVMWQESLSAVRGAGGVLAGQMIAPLDAIRMQEVYPRGFSSHNMLVETFLRLGLVGASLLVIVTVQALRRGSRNFRLILVPCIVALIVYGVSYEWPPWTWVVIGISFAVVERRNGGRKVPNRGEAALPQIAHS